MNVRIRFFARFREFFGPEVVTEVEDDISVAGVICTVTDRNPEGKQAIFDEGGRLRRHVIIMRNGERLTISQTEEIRVSDGDEIAVFPPVAGG
jgi:molybdopterin synthase sulfur carrier subunit